MFFLSVHHMIPRNKFFDYLKQFVTLDVLEACHHSNIFDKTVHCLGKKQGMTLANDECSIRKF